MTTSCPRCQNLLVPDRDGERGDLCCLACGHRVYATPIAVDTTDTTGRRTGARAGRRRTKDYSGS